MKHFQSICELVLAAVCLCYYILCLFLGGGSLSMLVAWPILTVIFTFSSISGIMATIYGRRCLRIVSRILDATCLSVLCLFLLFAIFVFSDMDAHGAPDCDCIVVLGAAVNGDQPSEVLQARIDAAYDYLIQNKTAIVIGTGGRSDEDTISEGRCIAQTLADMGIAQERIRYEERSTTTVENIKYALELAPEQAQSIAVVSSGFHVFRAKQILSCYTDASVSGISCSGLNIFTPHYILREFIVLIIDVINGNYSLI